MYLRKQLIIINDHYTTIGKKQTKNKTFIWMNKINHKDIKSNSKQVKIIRNKGNYCIKRKKMTQYNTDSIAYINGDNNFDEAH